MSHRREQALTSCFNEQYRHPTADEITAVGDVITWCLKFFARRDRSGQLYVHIRRQLCRSTETFRTYFRPIKIGTDREYMQVRLGEAAFGRLVANWRAPLPPCLDVCLQEGKRFALKQNMTRHMSTAVGQLYLEVSPYIPCYWNLQCTTG